MTNANKDNFCCICFEKANDASVSCFQCPYSFCTSCILKYFDDDFLQGFKTCKDLNRNCASPRKIPLNIELPKNDDSTIALFFAKTMLHDCTQGEVFDCPDRAIEAFASAHTIRGIKVLMRDVQATDEVLLIGNVNEKYLDHLKSFRSLGLDKSASLDVDEDLTRVVRFSEKMARIAVQAHVDCFTSVFTGEFNRAFILSRPPSHHNFCHKRLKKRMHLQHACSGGCIFNSTCIAIENYRMKCKERGEPDPKVMILDIDAHFGDGTAYWFYDDDRVYTISLHMNQIGWFPFLTGNVEERGFGKGLGFNLNLPLPSNEVQFCGDKFVRSAFEEIINPEIEKFAPDLVVLSCGFDGLENDPSNLGKLHYTTSIYPEILQKICDSHPRVICTLEGGYQPNLVARCVSSCIHVLKGDYISRAKIRPTRRKTKEQQKIDGWVQQMKDCLENAETWIDSKKKLKASLFPNQDNYLLLF